MHLEYRRRAEERPFVYADSFTLPVVCLMAFPVMLMLKIDSFAILMPYGVVVFILFVLYGIRKWVVGRLINPDLIPYRSYKVRGMTGCITGGTSGLGKELARQMLLFDFREVIIGTRNMKAAKRMKKEFKKEFEKLGNRLVFYKLDLEDFTSIREFVTSLKKHGTINFFVNNAGVCGVQGITKEGFEKHFGVNYLGPFYLYHIYLRFVCASNTYLVNVSSFNHKYAKKIPFEKLKTPCDHLYRQERYNFSKLCVEMFTKELAIRLRRDLRCSLKVSSVCPGVVRTNISRHYLGNFWLLQKFYHSIGFFLTKGVYEGCQTLLFTILFRKKIKSGGYYKDCAISDRGENCKDIEFQRDLWKFSDDYVRKYERDRKKRQNPGEEEYDESVDESDSSEEDGEF